MHSNDPFAILFQSAPLMAYQFDMAYQLTSLAQGLIQIPGFQMGTFLNSLFAEQPESVAQLPQVLAGQSIQIVTSHPGAFLKHWINPLRDPSGIVVGGFGFAVDITDQLRVEAELRAAKAEAERANQAKSEFVSRVSHELRTPMNAILGFAQLLQADDNLSPRQLIRIEHILRAGQHLLELINEILDVSRIESGSLSVMLEAIPLADMLREVLDIIEPIATAQGVTVVPQYEPTALGLVMTDQQRLAQVLLNLLSNAVKYNRPGGRVTIQILSTQPSFVRVIISDTGVGISQASLQQLFSPFERLGYERSPIEGNGLGLALSQRLMKLLGGMLGVTSIEGQGSDFWIDVPAWESAAFPTATVATPPSHSDLHRWKVLYIDPYIEGTHLIEDILSNRSDIRLLRAMQGRLGIELARAQQPDLIMLDLTLPDISGEEVLRQVQHLPETSHIPVVVLSSTIEANEQARLYKLGARACIHKPVTATTLLDLLDELAPSRQGPVRHVPQSPQPASG
jgi:signal transduction histidine kinase/BarA-like signal transduction histidine kinase